ncbi:MAG: hypothetical protein AMXMBFR34_05700 [Myxococcaceae bacterium]
MRWELRTAGLLAGHALRHLLSRMTRPRLRGVAIVGTLLFSCAHGGPAAPVVAPPAQASPDELTLERTACSGACPVYSVTVRRDGRVHYTGVKDVALVGERDWRVEATFLRHLFSEVERSGFLSMGPRYPTEVEELPGLGALVDKLTGCGRFVETDSKKQGGGCVD